MEFLLGIIIFLICIGMFGSGVEKINQRAFSGSGCGCFILFIVFVLIFIAR
jgi:hypothetical protein